MNLAVDHFDPATIRGRLYGFCTCVPVFACVAGVCALGGHGVRGDDPASIAHAVTSKIDDNRLINGSHACSSIGLIGPNNFAGP